MKRNLILIVPFVLSACCTSQPIDNQKTISLNIKENRNAIQTAHDNAISAPKNALDKDKIRYGTPPTIKAVADWWVVTFPPPELLPSNRGYVVIGPGAVEVRVNVKTLEVEKIFMEPN